MKIIRVKLLRFNVVWANCYELYNKKKQKKKKIQQNTLTGWHNGLKKALTCDRVVIRFLSSSGIRGLYSFYSFAFVKALYIAVYVWFSYFDTKTLCRISIHVFENVLFWFENWYFFFLTIIKRLSIVKACYTAFLRSQRTK